MSMIGATSPQVSEFRAAFQKTSSLVRISRKCSRPDELVDHAEVHAERVDAVVEGQEHRVDREREVEGERGAEEDRDRAPRAPRPRAPRGDAGEALGKAAARLKGLALTGLAGLARALGGWIRREARIRAGAVSLAGDASRSLPYLPLSRASSSLARASSGPIRRFGRPWLTVAT